MRAVCAQAPPPASRLNARGPRGGDGPTSRSVVGSRKKDQSVGKRARSSTNHFSWARDNRYLTTARVWAERISGSILRTASSDGPHDPALLRVRLRMSGAAGCGRARSRPLRAGAPPRLSECASRSLRHARRSPPSPVAQISHSIDTGHTESSKNRVIAFMEAPPVTLLEYYNSS